MKNISVCYLSFYLQKNLLYKIFQLNLQRVRKPTMIGIDIYEKKRRALKILS